jgi:hypothetical protein
MRSITKATLRTSIAGFAVAGVIIGGAGVASAAPVAPAHSASPKAPFCNPFQRERWNLNGKNTLTATFQGSDFTYTVKFRQAGSCLGGFLTDPYVQPSGLTGPITGTIYKNYVTFSFDYGATSVQGLRTYVGTINKWGSVSGFWTQTGSQGPSTPNPQETWSLGKNARPACPFFFWWGHPNRGCFVFPHYG